jgi:hypothetical protein
MVTDPTFVLSAAIDVDQTVYMIFPEKPVLVPAPAR